VSAILSLENHFLDSILGLCHFFVPFHFKFVDRRFFANRFLLS